MLSNYQKSLKELEKQKSLKEVLHISKAGLTLCKEQEFFCVKNSKETISKIHANKLKSIIINVNITLTSEVLFLASKYKISVQFINKELDCIDMYTSSKSSKTFLAQARLEDEFRLNLAKNIIIAKCKNQLNYIKRMNKYHKKYDENILKMMKLIKKLKNAKNNQEILAYEGGVALWYYECLCDRFKKFGFLKRHKKGAKDVVNMSLNYLYGILYNKILKLIIDNGLSPYIGVLHTNNDKNISFVFDVIEEFRVYVVDFVVFGWFSYNPNVFDEGELSKELKEKLSKRLATRMLDKLSYKNQKTSIENILALQIQTLKKAILNNSEYKGFCPRL